eukprot:TRINITY_DN72432_c0_g1_i1.p1 TRINITY_DN72432_c0_g1~~TRINITY_DN72432_c0_g1_i1.p1  ORF type:complete len:608 (-),score=137.70 TRINITY_DN72432_c0_g1_i1:280-2052(-)
MAAVVADELPQGITKEVLKPAPDDNVETPQTDDECEVSYVGHLATGEEFDSSEDHHGGNLTFKLGSAGTIRGWDLAIRTMRRGETAKFTFTPEFGYGSAGHPPRIPGNATLIFEITLVCWRSFSDLFGDGEVVRTKVKDGISVTSPADGCAVLCSVQVCAEDGHVFEDTPSTEYTIGSGAFGPVSRAVDRALADMRKGARVKLRCSKAFLGESVPEPVVVDLTLHEIFEIDDVSPEGDRSIVKKVAVHGKGSERPEDGAAVRLVVEAAFFPAGKPAPGFKGKTKLRFTLGSGEVCDALEYGVLGMLTHEHAILTCSRPALCADAQLGLSGLASVKPSEKGGDEAMLMVALEGFEPAKSSSEMTSEERLRFASAQKDLGASLFKAQRHRLALRKYQSVVDLFSGKKDLADAEKKEMRKVCQLNSAMCMLKLGDNRGASTACTYVLAEEPDNVKALFRRASARLALDEFPEAVSDLRHLLEVDSENKDAQRLLSQAVRDAKVANKSASATFGKMCQALDGKDAEDQARKMEEARHTKKPGQVLSVAEQEEAWEKALKDAKKTLADVIATREAKTTSGSDGAKPSEATGAAAA